MPHTVRDSAKALTVGAVFISITAAVLACTPAAEPTEPAFALTSADIVLPEGREYPINLIFLAEADAPIWSDLAGVELPGSASVGPGQFEVLRGEGVGGQYLGNISFDVAVSTAGLAFESVGLIYAQRTDPVRVAVGEWNLREAPSEEFVVARTHAEIASLSGCTSADLPIPEDVASVDAVDAASHGVQIADYSLTPESSAVTVTITCSDDADFFVISPTIDYTNAEGMSEVRRFAPIAIGFQDIDDKDLARIRER